MPSDASDPVQRAHELRDRFQLKIFRMMLQVAFIFAIPAFVAFFVGKRFDVFFGTERQWLFGLLVFAFIFSWVLVIRMYRRLSREARAVDQAVRDARRELTDNKK